MLDDKTRHRLRYECHNQPCRECNGIVVDVHVDQSTSEFVAPFVACVWCGDDMDYMGSSRCDAVEPQQSTSDDKVIGAFVASIAFWTFAVIFVAVLVGVLVSGHGG